MSLKECGACGNEVAWSGSCMKCGWEDTGSRGFQGLKVGAFVFTCMGVAIFAFEIHTWTLAGGSADWPTAPGEVIKSRVTELHGEDGTKYFAKIRYRYEVAGQSYTAGDIYIQPVGLPTSRAEAEARVQPYPAGDAVTVSYNPSDPGTAVLRPGRRRGLFSGQMAFALSLMLIGVGSFIYYRRGLRLWGTPAGHGSIARRVVVVGGVAILGFLFLVVMMAGVTMLSQGKPSTSPSGPAAQVSQ